MRLPTLFWYISGMFTLWFLMTLFISYGPGAELFAFGHQAIAAGGAVVFTIVASLVGRLPDNHWFCHWRPAWAAGVVIALAVTLLVAMMG